ncbi:uncharacterized protein LOC128739839 [Sabethes cyaneus]|uniref:uncharacterized protein LOC128739839 n=1 Tax=Sabethes cyaneus TaxID=53552 RepID=UPI00237DBF4D|nr:uncharacterized protein LOC128739839 [Sabethes cyaneus]
MVKKISEKRSGKKKPPKMAAEKQLELLRTEADNKWHKEQEALLAKDRSDLKQYNQRRAGLIESDTFFRKLEKTAQELNRQIQHKTEWEQYLSCENKPNSANAADLRDFLYRWNFETEKDAQNSTSWTLNVSERSVLTQDEQEPVKTRKVLETENDNLIYKQHLDKIKQALKVLALTENSTQKEVLLVRDEIRQKILDTLGGITMEIGRNIWRDMKPLDSISAEFSIASDILQFYIWSFRDVPLPSEYNYLIKSLPMKTLNVKLSKPVSMDLKDSLVRGYWTWFDHYSDQDRNFRCGTQEAVPDLVISQEIEWAERNALRMQKLQSMKSARAKYEEDKAKQELEQQENAKSAGKNVKKETKKTKKGKQKNDAPNVLPDIPPPIVTESTTVNIENEYIGQEMAQYNIKMKEIGPEALNLSEGMVNLRQYRITGGIYTFDWFCKLPQTVELRCDFIYASIPTDIKLTELPFVGESDEELIKIEFKLAECCFWWHEPIVCSWEPWEESQEFQSLDEKLKDFHLNYDKTMEEKAKLLLSAPKPIKNLLKPTIVPDFDLNDIPTDIKLHFLIMDHILPRLPQNFKFHAELQNLFQTLVSKLHHDQRVGIEELLNELLYPKFLAMQASNKDPLETTDEMLRLPSLSDVPEGKKSVASFDGPLIDTNVTTPAQSLLQELNQDVPSYLFPPVNKIPLLVITEKTNPQINEQEIDEIVLELQEVVASDDEFGAESVCKMFSTFLKLLDRLREQEQPQFAEVVTPEETEMEQSRKVSRASKDLSHRHWLNPRQPIRRMSSFLMPERPRQRLSRGSTVEGKKKRKHKTSAVMSASDVSTDDERESAPLVRDSREELQLLDHPKGSWTTKLVRKQEFDPAAKKITIWVKQLGTFGFAMEKYYNLPFKQWDLRRYGKMADLTTILTLECVSLTVEIRVTKSGYRVAFHDAPKQDISVPVNEVTLDELKQYLAQANVTIFPEPDAPFYVRKMTSAKHQSMEIHNLKAMAAFCLTHNFRSSFWNRYCSAREALIEYRQPIEGRKKPQFTTVMMSPQAVSSVTVKELCSPLDLVLLEYCPTPANQSYNPDVYHLLKDTLEEPSRKLLLETPPMLQWNVAQLLLQLRLLSYS